MRVFEMIKFTDTIDSIPQVFLKNTKSVNESLADILSSLINSYWIEPVKMNSISVDVDGSKLDRKFYDWQNYILKSIRNNVNFVTDIFNKNDLLLPPEYEQMQHIKFAYDENVQLAYNYQRLFNNEIFSAIEQRIIDFYTILENEGVK